MDVGDVGGVIVGVDDAVICIAPLPDIQLTLQSKGEASLYELHCFFERDLRGGCDEQVDMIGHDDEGVELKAILFSLLLKNVD
ncbi:MAG TPA: hypothetical protein VNY74_01665 [Edaphobacter sp.]|nr:hypothetical protein [Edaphobacter sp.]